MIREGSVPSAAKAKLASVEKREGTPLNSPVVKRAKVRFKWRNLSWSDFANRPPLRRYRIHRHHRQYLNFGARRVTVMEQLAKC